MHVLIIGAGVVGVTTAWALAQRGHRVTVVERAASSALETSYANAGQRSYGHVSPWASPAMIRQALPSLLRAAGPLKARLPPSSRTVQFAWSMWRCAGQGNLYRRNLDAMLRLGRYSRDRFLALEEVEDLAFDGEHQGLLKLASDAEQKTDLLATAETLERLDIECRWLDAEAARAHEPGLDPGAPLAGGLLVPGDGTGDCYRFSEALAERCRAAGVEFRFDTEVTHLRTDADELQALQVRGPAGEAWLDADAYVVCAGCGSRDIAFSLGVHLPIYPVKGYSLTAPLADPERAPRSTLVDEARKVAITRLGERVRVTGFAELADFDRRLKPARLNSLRRSLETRFPGAADWQGAEPWAGFRPMTPDGPAALGRARQRNVLFNTGHGTWGWTLSMGSAELMADLIDDRAPAVELDAFHAGRFTAGLA